MSGWWLAALFVAALGAAGAAREIGEPVPVRLAETKAFGCSIDLPEALKPEGRSRPEA